jgi:hypothetical protein
VELVVLNAAKNPGTSPLLLQLLLPVSFPFKRAVISTEAARALSEQRSGEIRFFSPARARHDVAASMRLERLTSLDQGLQPRKNARPTVNGRAISGMVSAHRLCVTVTLVTAVSGTNSTVTGDAVSPHLLQKPRLARGSYAEAQAIYLLLPVERT